MTPPFTDITVNTILLEDENALFLSFYRWQLKFTEIMKSGV